MEIPFSESLERVYFWPVFDATLLLHCRYLGDSHLLGTQQSVRVSPFTHTPSGDASSQTLYPRSRPTTSSLNQTEQLVTMIRVSLTTPQPALATCSFTEPPQNATRRLPTQPTYSQTAHITYSMKRELIILFPDMRSICIDN